MNEKSKPNQTHSDGRINLSSEQVDEARRRAEEHERMHREGLGRIGLALGMSHELGPSRMGRWAKNPEESITDEDRERYRKLWGESERTDE